MNKDDVPDYAALGRALAGDPIHNTLQYLIGMQKETLQELETKLREYMTAHNMTPDELAQMFCREMTHEHVNGRLKMIWRVYHQKDMKLFAESSLMV